ncbi:MAG: TIGR03545 family protein, partial [Planctomycetes bacterium]|nr:TIGR03545 family protein [Planctomycetota bacterium]
MIRWKYAAPRLILLGAILVTLWFGLNPAVRWAILSTGQSATSAKVDVGSVETSLLRTELRLADVAVANPQAKRKNLFEADQVVLRLDANALLRRKLVVREGRMSGLRLGSKRSTSGALDPNADWSVDLPQVDLPQFDQAWLGRLDAIFKQELVDQANRLASVQLAKELIERWPDEYDRIQARTDSLRQRIDNLRELSKTDGKNVLRALDTYQQAALELENVRREVVELRDEIDRLGNQVVVDREAIVRAKEEDLRKIRETVRLENLSPENLSEYFLGAELTETIQTVARWVHWGRQHLPAEVDAAHANRGRGIDVAFPGTRPRPDFLIQSLVLDGEGQLGQQRFLFRATAAGITTQPRLYGQPVVVRAQINAETRVEVEAVLDHTSETPRERIIVNCPCLMQPERVLGRPGELAVVVAPGSTHLWALLELEGDALTGQLLVKQGPVKLVPDLADAYGGQRLAGSLEEALSQVREIRVTVDLAGTLNKPHWKLKSNLGPQLAAALDGLLQRELELRREQLVAYVDRQIDDQLAQLERSVLAKQEEFLAKVDLNG